MDDDDDNNNNVNKYKITGGNVMGQIMKRSLTKECTEKSGKVVSLQGWVKRFVI